MKKRMYHLVCFTHGETGSVFIDQTGKVVKLSDGDQIEDRELRGVFERMGYETIFLCLDHSFGLKKDIYPDGSWGYDKSFKKSIDHVLLCEEILRVFKA